jgi:uncharacterized protein
MTGVVDSSCFRGRAKTVRVPPAPHRAARCLGPAGSAGWWSLPRQPGSPARAAAAPPGTIAVTGNGAARAVPDLMHFGVAVEVVRLRAVDAMAAVGANADALVGAARSLGIEPQDIRSGEVCLEADVPGGEPAGRGGGTFVGAAGPAGPAGVSGVSGYRAAETFQMTVRRLDYAGPTLEAIAEACGPRARITGIAFGVSRPEELRLAARREAYADACARAEHYALLAGRRLGPLHYLDEAPPAPAYLVPGGSATATGCAPPSPGTSDSVYEQVSVHAVFQLV